MKKSIAILTALAAAIPAAFVPSVAQADALGDAVKAGKFYANFRTRFEAVDQDNALDDAEALTLRSRIGFITGDVSGFSATIEFEDTRVVADVDDFNDTIGNGVGNSVIADPEHSEIDQAFLQYKTDDLTVKLGRQVLIYDNMRFIGHVGFRQDRQTYDGASLSYKVSDDFTLNASYLAQRNNIFAEVRDVNSADSLFNAAYKTSFGTLTGYGYLLEDEDAELDIDTFGFRFTGSQPMGDNKLLYTAEYATQEIEPNGGSDLDTDYFLVEGGVVISGLTIKLGYEQLGSDDGMVGFATPLATLHAFNGWADQFLNTPAQGLNDAYLFLGGKLFGGDWKVVYHDFEADEDTVAIDDFGDEIDFVYGRKFGDHYSWEIKYAAYSAGDDATNKVDTDKLFLAFVANF